MEERGFVAVDLGATSGRVAVSTLRDGILRPEIVTRRGHRAKRIGDRECWDIESLLAICRDGVQYAAQHYDTSTVAIDTWGVDSGVRLPDGGLQFPVVAYRDASHVTAFEELASLRSHIFSLTGVQHQPFNTLYQLRARTAEGLRPEGEWLLLPALLARRLGSKPHHELTMASTTQLLHLRGGWCKELFDLCRWPLPDHEPSLPGVDLGSVDRNVQLVSVGSHDTASAVLGLGRIRTDQAFLNVGTWSLLGCLLDAPLVTAAVERSGFSNERAVDGRVRFLTNIPGFYVINRLHDELGINAPVEEWVEQSECSDRSVDLLDQKYFNPSSMRQAMADELADVDRSEWAAIALNSIGRAAASQLRTLSDVTGRRFAQLRVTGGGSGSAKFCQLVSDCTGIEVVAGPAESTIYGNLGMQLFASGAVASLDEACDVIGRSYCTTSFHPQV